MFVCDMDFWIVFLELMFLQNNWLLLCFHGLNLNFSTIFREFLFENLSLSSKHWIREQSEMRRSAIIRTMLGYSNSYFFSALLF